MKNTQILNGGTIYKNANAQNALSKILYLIHMHTKIFSPCSIRKNIFLIFKYLFVGKNVLRFEEDFVFMDLSFSFSILKNIIFPATAEKIKVIYSVSLNHYHDTRSSYTIPYVFFFTVLAFCGYFFIQSIRLQSIRPFQPNIRKPSIFLA